MNWVKNITDINNSICYASILPEEYYEWIYNSCTIRQGTVFNHYKFPIDKIADGSIIISASIPSNILKKSSRGLITIRPLQTHVSIEAGNITSKEEILNRYNDMKSNFNRGYNLFRQGLESRIFIIKSGKKKHNKLYKIVLSDHNSDYVLLEDYGEIAEIIKKIQVAQKLLRNKAQKKTGRAYEMSDFIKFNKLVDFIKYDIKNAGPKWQFVVKTAHIKPTGRHKEKWSDLYKSMSIKAQDTYNYINQIESLEWIKPYLLK